MQSLHGLILVALLATSIDGGDVTHWATTTCWSTAWATPDNEPVTYWQTSTYWETKWSTAPPETVYNTLWSTYVQPTTYISVETATETITEFVYSTQNNYFTNTETLNNYVTNTATEIQVSKETSTETGTVFQTGTVTATVTSARVLVTTLFSTVTEACTPTTTSLVGLVLCPYRDVNPTYTPPGPLPTDSLWGCAPGTLCTPKQINCNFERDFPADTYVCDPSDCVVPPPLPDTSGNWTDYNCTPFIPVEGYPNLSPIPFGLDYSIFEFNGQPGHSCPPPPPPPPTSTFIPPPPPSSTSTWEDWSSQAPPPPAPPASTWADWTSSAVPPPAVVSSSWADWSSPASAPSLPPTTTWIEWTTSAVIPSPSTSWQDWTSQSYEEGHSWSGTAVRPSITARANIAERDLIARALYDIPSDCYGPCDKAAQEAANCQLVWTKLCPAASPFSSNYDNCGSCIRSLKSTPINSPAVALVTSLVKFISFCANNSPTSPAAVSVTSTPSSTPKPSTASVSTTSTPTLAPTSSSPATTIPSSTSVSSPTTPASSSASSSAALTTAATSLISTTATTTPVNSVSPTVSTPSPSPFTGQAIANNVNVVAVAFLAALALLPNYI